MNLIRISIPSLFIDRLSNGYKISIAHIPPILTVYNSSGIYKELLEEIASRKGDLNFEFKDSIIFYSCILGGIMIYADDIPIARFEYNGYFHFSKSGKKTSMKELIRDLKRNAQDCYRFEENSICLTKERCNGCKWIDNIGIRIIYNNYGYSIDT